MGIGLSRTHCIWVGEDSTRSQVSGNIPTSSTRSLHASEATVSGGIDRFLSIASCWAVSLLEAEGVRGRLDSHSKVGTSISAKAAAGYWACIRELSWASDSWH